MPLLDEEGVRVRGKDNREQARLALARVKLVEQGELAPAPTAGGEWLVARVCSEYIQYCDRGVTNRTISADHRATAHLNDLCKYCGALPVAQLKKPHIRTWVESHTGWKSPATERSALAIEPAEDHVEAAVPLGHAASTDLARFTRALANGAFHVGISTDTDTVRLHGQNTK